MNIATVTIYVDDQERSLQFWLNLGFELIEKKPMTNKHFWIEVAPKNAQTRLVLYPKELMEDYSERKASIIFQCNVDKKYEYYKQKGVKFIEEPKQMPWGKFATFEDIDGNQFLLKDAKTN